MNGKKAIQAAILMTVSSSLGMVSLGIGTGAGKEILQPLAVVVLEELFTYTALTLLVIPALYAQFGIFVAPKKTTPLQEIEVAQGSVV